MKRFMDRYGFTRQSLIQFLLITANAELIYMFWNLRTSLTTPLMGVYSVDTAGLGIIAGLQGFVMLFLTIPLGWAGDKFSTRNIMLVSSVVSGGVGIMLTLLVPISPEGFWIVIAGYGFMLVFTEAIYKTTNLKAISLVTDDTHQAAAFGLFEMGRGIITFLEGVVSIWLFSVFGGATDAVPAMRWTMAICSCITLASALLLLVAFPPAEKEKQASAEKQDRESFSFKDLLTALKIPFVWVTGISVACAYAMFIMAATLVNTYMVDVFGLSAIVAGSLGLIISLARIIAPVTSGQLADRKFKSSAHLNMILFAIMAGVLAIELVLPKNNSLLVFAFAFAALAAFSCYMIRGIYFSPIGEGGVPPRIRASALAAATTIGYTPSLYGTWWFGSIIDQHKKAGDAVGGYNIVWAILLVYAIGGVACCWWLKRHWDKQHEEQPSKKDIAEAA
ncbi:MAG: MFS transporter [Propionibacteriaceae bacterium]|jgi:MFS family permease|nr:MFS transporter [Propionibacteriaceae bacterium]